MTEKDLVARLERVERENRQLKRAGFAALAGVLCLTLLGAMRSPGQPKVIEARQIIVRDPLSGNRAILDGQGLSLSDSSGTVRVELKSGTTGPKGVGPLSGDWIKLYDSKGRPGVELTEGNPPADFLQGFTRVQTSGNLVMLDYEGESVSAADIGVGEATGLWLTKTHLRNGREWPRDDDTDAAIIIDGGSAGMRVREHGKNRVGLFARGGMPGLDLVDAANYETQIGVAGLTNPKTGEARRTSAASILMLGEERRVIWQAP